MWTSLECDTDIQVLPVGEEPFHNWDSECRCCPRVSIGETGKLVMFHQPYDNRQLFEIAYYSTLHRVRQKRDC